MHDLDLRPFGLNAASRWNLGLSLTTQSGDRCLTGSWVFARDILVCSLSGYDSQFGTDTSSQDKLVLGRVVEILIPETSSSMSSTALVTLEIFALGAVIHPDFDLPVLSRPSTAPSHVIVDAKVSLL